MLIQFAFKNFKSFRDDTILDLSATKITEHSDHVIPIGNEKLLPIAAIYGANASGKSNVLEAFRFMVMYVMNSVGYVGIGDEKKSNIRRLKHTPFLFDSVSKEAESSFEVYFTSPQEEDGKTYNYGFTLNYAGVAEEWLNVKSKSATKYKSIFYRNDGELDLSGLPKKSQENIRVSLNKDTLVVSLGALLKVVKLEQVMRWFCHIYLADFGNPIENALLSSLIPDGFKDNKDIQQNVVNYFSTFDPSIVGFHVEVTKDADDTEHIQIDSLHRRIDSDETASIPLKEESGGTLKMFALYPVLQDALNTGGVLLIDELNARLHPLLVRNFLITFLNPKTNPKHAQLVFTTHDSWQLANHLLRRDEIWFTEKDAAGVSSLYSLADFVDEDGDKIRKDENYEKNYLLGKYGAIPALRNLGIIGEE